MDNQVSIDFTGLCVFVTNAPNHRLKVILARDPAGKMVHRPIVSFDVASLSHVEGRLPIQVIQMPDGAQIASWNVQDRILRLKDWSCAYPSWVKVCRGDDRLPSYPPDPSTEMDARWVPSLRTVSDSSKVLPVYLQDNPKPSKGATSLAARFDIGAGYLFANAEVNRRSPMECWEFDCGSRVHRQYLADSMRLELRSHTSEPLVIEAYRFGNLSDPAETLELLPSNGRIALAVSNLPDALPGSEAHAAHSSMHGDGMPHFGIYYTLLDRPKRRPIPTRSSRPCAAVAAPAAGEVMNADMHGVAPVKCTPGMVP
jgi:hypothetical protein